ncbi:MAG: EutN/CcmL family microcompartment protein [Pirellulaceae bacterium]|nr:EutN/CcmL family microcompartment protein [Planctomycetales bacterium]
MQLATVIGRVTATLKHESMRGAKLMLVQPQTIAGTPDGEPFVAVDAVGAAMGQRVMLTSDGRFSRSLLKVDATPVRWTIIGIKDDE